MARIIDSRFNDFDELADAAKGWRLELSKLDRSAFCGEGFQWITDRFIISRGRFGCRLKQAGGPPPGLRTVVVPLARNMSMFWRDHQVSGDDVLVFPFDGELDAVSDQRFDICTLSFEEEALFEQAERMGFSQWTRGHLSAEVFCCAPDHVTSLRGPLLRVIRDLRVTAGEMVIPQQRIQREIIRLIGGATSTAPVRHRSRRRLRIVQDAKFILEDCAGEGVTVRDLSCAVGTSIRTLQYAFQEHLGVSPKVYINSLRLNAAHRALRVAGPGTTCVADVANGLGFWHMGQFAADYRRHFGENPSATLGRR